MRRGMVVILIVLMFAIPCGPDPLPKSADDGNWNENRLDRQTELANGEGLFTGTGDPRPVYMKGVHTTGGSRTFDFSYPGFIGWDAPAGWTADFISASINGLSTWMEGQVVNGLLNDYHNERWLGIGHDADVVQVPDGWTLIKHEDGAGTGRDPHPLYGNFEMNDNSGSGYDNTMGWSFDVSISGTDEVTSSDEVYISQQILMPYREVHSAEVKLLYHVIGSSDLQDQIYLSVRFAGYQRSLYVVEAGDTTDEWLSAIINVPSSALASVAVPGAALLEIGIGTDLNLVGSHGFSASSSVLVDEVELRLRVRPFPEQINLKANGASVTGGIMSSVSPYVPDGANRDCFSYPGSGVDLDGYVNNGVLEVGADAFDAANVYQMAFQLPVDIPQGAAILSARLEVEAESGASPTRAGMRVYVANENTVSPFTSGFPVIKDRYNWVDTSEIWFPSVWNGDARYMSPDISALVQKVISRSGWTSGNYILVMLDYVYSDVIMSWNNAKGSSGYLPADLARLYIDYLDPQPDTINTFQNKKVISINHDKVTGELTDFPVLIDIYDTDLRTDVQPDGDDIAFMIGKQTLDHEIEMFDQAYNATHAHLVAWVRVPNLSSSSDTRITMLYGCDAIGSQENPQSVWDSDYATVWHLNDNPGGSSPQIADSAWPYTDGTTFGSMAPGQQVEGKIGTAIDLDGADDYIDFGQPYELQMTSAITIEAWFRGDFIGNDYLVTKHGTERGWDLSFDPGVAPDGEVMFRWSPDGVENRYCGKNAIEVGQWYHLVAVFKPNEYSRLYVNGQLVGENTTDIRSAMNNPAYPVRIGRRSDDTVGSVNGIVDEIRISDIARSPDWVATSFSNQNDPASFYGVGTEESITPTTFQHKKTITVHNEKVFQDCTDFPVLIELYDANLRTDVQPDGDDILFMSGGESLSHEIEVFDQTYNSTHTHLVAWVNVPSLSSSVNTEIEMLYGNSALDSQEDPEAVWANNYAGVWHLAEVSGNALDSTTYDTQGMLSGGITQGVQGAAGYAYEFDGVSGTTVNFGDPVDGHLDFGTSSFSYSFWLRIDQSTGTWQLPFYKGGSSNPNRGYEFETTSDGSVITAWISDGTAYKTSSSTSVSLGQWMHLVAVVDRSSDTLRLYRDGAPVGSPTDISTTGSLDTTFEFQLSRSDYPHDGLCDEARIISASRSAGWIATEYENQKDPSSFYSITAEEEPPPPGTPWYDTDWPYRKKVTIDPAKVGGDPWFDQDWEYRKRLTITAGSAAISSDYTVSVTCDHGALVSDGKSRADGDDIRILHWNGTGWKDLDRMLDPGSSWGTDSTKIWFKTQAAISAFSSDDNYYLYYSNPSAGSPSVSSSNVFLFYDGFESGDLTGWDAFSEESGDSISASSDRAHTGTYSGKGQVDDVASAQAIVWEDFPDEMNLLARMHIYLPVGFSTTGHVTVMEFIDTSSGWQNLISATINDDMTLYIWNDFFGEAYGYQATNTISTGTWHTLEMQGKISDTTGEARLWLDGNLEIEATGRNLSTEGIDRFAAIYYWASPQTEPNTVYGDDIHLRPYVTSEPSSALGSEKENGLASFPLLISTTDTQWKDSINGGHVGQADGGDILFTTSDGTSKLDHEIEQYDPTTGNLLAWVEIPTLYSAKGTDIYIYYGNADAADQWSTTGTWGSDYLGVWHLSEGTGNALDSTSYGEDGPLSGGVTQGITGQIGGAYDFDGIDGRVTIGDPADGHLDFGANDDYTIAMWISVDSSGGVSFLIAKRTGTGASATGYAAALAAGPMRFEVADGIDEYSVVTGTTFSSPTWHHLVIVWDDDSTSATTVYLDGTEDLGSTIGTLANIDSIETSTSLSFGSALAGLFAYDGRLDEIRIIGVARTAPWINTEFNNQDDPSSFYSVSNEEWATISFDCRKDITVDHTRVSADLTDFPVLIDIYDEDLQSDVQPDGDDIMFRIGNEFLSHEVELFDQTYNSTHAHLIAWAKVDLSSTVDTTITMYYGNSEISTQENPNAVWDEDYVGVWHLSEDPSGTIYDSTSSTNDGTSSGGMTSDDQIAGQIGGSLDFDATDDYVNVGSASSLDNIEVKTVSAWVQLGDATEANAIVAKGSESAQTGWFLFYDSDVSRRRLAFIQAWSGAIAEWHTADLTMDVDTMFHVTVTYNRGSTANDPLLYIDGVSMAVTERFSPSGTIGDDAALDCFIAKYGPEPLFGDGNIDEVRISDVMRSAEWIATEYNNQYDPASFYSVGDEQGPEPVEFQYKKDIIIDHTKVNSDLTDFPALIDLYDTDLRTDVQFDGDDIAFVLGGETLDHEIELFDQSYNSTHAHLVAWVKADLSSSVDTTISMYYGNPTIESQENPERVWNSNYVAVWHMNYDPSSSIMPDSTMNDYDLTPIGFDSDQRIYDGKLGTAIAFDGINDYLVISSLSGPTDGFTFETWFKFDAEYTVGGGEMYLFSGNTPSWGNNMPRVRFRSSTGSGVGSVATALDDSDSCDGTKNVWAANTWFHYAFRFSVPIQTTTLYLNGTVDGIKVDSDLAVPHSDWNMLSIASDYGANVWGSGAISEFRILNTPVSADWIAADYANQNDPASFYSVGGEVILQVIEFTYKKEIAIDHSRVSSDLSDFPVLIDLYDTDLRTDVQADGDDIAFIAGEQSLNHEIELFDQAYNSTHAHLVAWVKVNLSASMDTVITMLYGNPDAPNLENQAGVWDNGYMGVWHLAKTSGNVRDSTSYDQDGTPSGGVTQGVIGKTGNANDFDGVDGFINFGDPVDGHLDFGTGSFTISIWLKIDASTGTWQVPLNKGHPSALDSGYRFETSTNGQTIRFQISDASSYEFTNTQSVTFGTWMHFVGRVERSSNEMHLFKDGSYSGFADISGIGSVSSTDNLTLSRGLHLTCYIDGILDEIRISNIAHSDDWIATEYSNQNDPASFYSVGEEIRLHPVDFAYKKDIVIDPAKVGGELTGFPVLINLYDADLKTDVQPDGDDIIFTINDQMLYHEIELFNQFYNSTHAHLIAWVRVPTLSNSTSTTLSMYYGNPEVGSQQNPRGVWDSGYLGTWHLTESGDGSVDEYRDSSQYENHGQGGEGDSLYVPTRVSGKIGYGQDFNNLSGKYNLIDCGDNPLWDITGNQITLQAWIQHDITDPNRGYGIMNHKGWYDGYNLKINYGGGSTIKPVFDLPGDTYRVTGANDVTGGTWHHVVAVYDGSFMRIYVDGVQDPNITPKTDNIEPSSSEKGFWIGHADQPKDVAWSGEFEGQIDEVRISTIARSVGWIQTEFNNQYNPSSFYAVGDEQVVFELLPPGLSFTTNSTSEVLIDVTFTLNVSSQTLSLANDLSYGTSYRVENGTTAIWTAGVMVSPEPEIENISFSVGYPVDEWTPVSVKNPLGVVKATPSDWTYADGLVHVKSSAIDVHGVWIVEFKDTNHIANLQMGPSGGEFAPSSSFSVNDLADFRAWTAGTGGSAVEMILYDPTGSIWYSNKKMFEGQGFSVPYLHKKDITIDHTKVVDDLTGFPVLIDIWDDDLRTDVQPDGDDIVFKIAGETVSHEIELFNQAGNGTHAHLVAWVQVPSLSSSVDTVVSMFYGSSGAEDQSNPSVVWSNSFGAVWHMTENPSDGTDGGVKDSTLNDNDGTPYNFQDGGGGTTDATGKIGGANLFGGDDDHITITSPTNTDPTSEVAVSAWVRISAPEYGEVVSRGDNYGLRVRADGDVEFFKWDGGWWVQLVAVGYNVADDQWHHLAGVQTATGMFIYIDGVERASNGNTDSIVYTAPDTIELGMHGDGDSTLNFTGPIDEVRISSVSRTEGWITTEFNNQGDPASFHSIGSEVTPGVFTFEDILFDSSADVGVWTAKMNYYDDQNSVVHRVGTFERIFIVAHDSQLTLRAPIDAIGDNITARVIGEQLYVEFELNASVTSSPISGASVTMNWTVHGSPTVVQLNDYGNGVYGKTLNMTDLALAGRWRIEFGSYHPHYNNATAYLYVDVSSETYLTHQPPSPVPYGEDLSVRVTLRDSFDDTPLSGASFTTNGTFVGPPTDYGNGTYLITLNGAGLSIGTHSFQLNATPSDSYLLPSTIDITFTIRELKTDAYAVGSDQVSVPWGHNATATLHWYDVEHSDVGIPGGAVSGDADVVAIDLGGGDYAVTIDISSYAMGTYLINLTVSKANYQSGTVTIRLIVMPHATTVGVVYDDATPVGTDTLLNLTYYDFDFGSLVISSGNLSQIIVDWGTGSSSHSSFEFWLDTDGWAVGVYIVNLTVMATTSPRYYEDAAFQIQIEIRRLNVYLTWEHLDPIPNGDDFEIILRVNVSEPGTPFDGDPIDGLPGSYFSAQNSSGVPYTIKSLAPLSNGRYRLIIDNDTFAEGDYTIIVFLDFALSENYTDTQTPEISFTYRATMTYISSPDYPQVTTIYGTNVSVTLNYVDIDRSLNITTATITAEGASIVWQHIGDGIYDVLIIVTGWDQGVHQINITADASGYEAKTLPFDVLVRVAFTYARPTVTALDLPVGDTVTFYVDYWDIDHDEPILSADVNHNWSHPVILSWTGSEYRIDFSSYDTDALGNYLVMFNFSKGPNFQFGYFNISVSIRTHYTEFRLASIVEPTSYGATVNISVYYGDLDNDIGIISSMIYAYVTNETDALSSILVNDTIRGAGYYIIRVAASEFGPAGLYNFTVFFNWTGPVQKYYNRTAAASVNIIGEDSKLTLLDAPGPTAYLGNMTYTYFFSEVYSGQGISNFTTGHVFVYVEFIGETVDLLQVSIEEFDPIGNPGHYSIEFNTTLLGRPGVYTMLVYFNWSAGAPPYYPNRTNTMSVRILARNTLVSLAPISHTPYGENVTVFFIYNDMTNGIPEPIADDPMMIIAFNLSDYTLTYNLTSRTYAVSFNTSILGASVGGKSFTIDVTWSGSPFYGNVSGCIVPIVVTLRITELDYPTPEPTSYGDAVTFSVTYNDITDGPPSPIDDATIRLYHEGSEIPAMYYTVTPQGSGEYEIQLNTSYFTTPGVHDLTVNLTTNHFYLPNATPSRAMNVRYRMTALTSEPVGFVPYNSSIEFVLHYRDLLTLFEIGNLTNDVTLEVLNGSSWIFTSTWREASQDYLVVVETFDHALNVHIPYVLWLNISFSDQTPFYLWSDAYVGFELRPRASSLDLTDPPMPTSYLEYINFTVSYRDIDSLTGIANASISLYKGLTQLLEGLEYSIVDSADGTYLVSVNTTALDGIGTTLIRVDANWTVGSPYYENSTLSFILTVNRRPTNVEIVVPPSQTRYLDNVSFTFRYIDVGTGQPIPLTKGDVSIHSGGVLLNANEFSMTVDGSTCLVSINSTFISSGLVTNWNVTTLIDWNDINPPYYEDGRVSLRISTSERIGTVGLGSAPTVPVGDNMSLTFSFTDEANGLGIGDAIVYFDCLNPSGLVDNLDYWVIAGTGVDTGSYTILVDTSVLTGAGAYTFSLDVQWNSSLSPYYQNVSTLYMTGSARLIQAVLTNDVPSPSTVPYYRNVSVVLNFTDLDHSRPIDGAESVLTLVYKSTGLAPAVWDITPLGSGLYEIVVNCSDAGPPGTDVFIVNIDLYPYQEIHLQIPFQIRLRDGRLSGTGPAGAIVHEPTYVVVQLEDLDAMGALLEGASLTLIWGDSVNYVDLLDGRYNISLTTSALAAGIHTLSVHASLADYFIPDVTIDVELKSIPTNLIMPVSVTDVYWGENLTIHVFYNDTHHDQPISGADVTYQLGVLSEPLVIASPGNYSFTLNTSRLIDATTYILWITAFKPDYETITAQITINILKLPDSMFIPSEIRTQTLYRGEPMNVTVYLEDTHNGVPLTAATVAVEWVVSAEPLYLLPVSGMPGYFTGFLDTSEAEAKPYTVTVTAQKHNHLGAFTTLSLTILNIPTELWLDAETTDYSSQTFNWSDTVRIGVYVLVPYLNETHPYSTGLSDCVVRWELSGTGVTDAFENGTDIGGPGFYYYDFDSSEFAATAYTMRIYANPLNPLYSEASNRTTLVFQRIATFVESPYVSGKVWGWTGWVNFTYRDLVRNMTVDYAMVSCFWGDSWAEVQPLGNGVYSVLINTSVVRPGSYPVSVAFEKENFEGATGFSMLEVYPVPTDIVVYVPEINVDPEGEVDIIVPYGDMIPLTFFYNDTEHERGISGATELRAILTGEPVEDWDTFEFTDELNGNYSLWFDTNRWSVNEVPFEIFIRLHLENRSRATIRLRVRIIAIPTLLIIQGPSTIQLTYGASVTVWVLYTDDWPGHDGQGVTDANITATTLNLLSVVVAATEPDPNRPGFYSITLLSQRVQGTAIVIIKADKENYALMDVSFTIVVEPSFADLLLEQSIIFGVPIGIVVLVGAYLWARIFHVPKRVREINKMMKAVEKGKIPKRLENVSTRQELLTGLFNDTMESIGISRGAADMPSESVTIPVPEIEQLLIQLSILTKITPQELEDFRQEVTKMKLSQQVAFAKEVINQEAIKKARLVGKKMEEVLEETMAQAQAVISGELLEPESGEPSTPGAKEKPAAEPRDTKIREAKSEEFEDRLREYEIEDLRKVLVKAGVPKQEMKTIISQVRELSRELVDELIDSILRDGGKE